MSTGTRLPLAVARTAAADAMTRWGIFGTGLVVGSIRRQKPEVGDIEIVAPIEDKKNDTLCAAITATMRPETDSIFGGAKGDYIGYAKQGLKPGFKAASVVLVAADGREIGCQVFRYTPQNRGWITLMRTGPGEFGEWFLGQWKRRWPDAHTKQASVDGHLVSIDGHVVPVDTEEACFKWAGLAFVPPEKRDEFMEARR